MSETPLPAPIEVAGPDCWPVLVRGDCAAAFDPTVEGYDVVVAETALSMAVAALRLLSGYSVGGCPIVARPCRSGWATDPSWAAYGTHPIAHPRLASGTWVNLLCRSCVSTACGCSVDELVLPGRVGRVDSIRLDGQEFTAWTVRGDVIVRTDGQPWPMRQRLDLDDTEEGTWSVTYLPATPVDPLGQLAAGALACEYVKALTGSTCALPPNATQINRQGVTITRVNEVFPDGMTGVRIVDLWVRRVNPHRLATPPTVWSPDVAAPHRMGG